MIKYAQIINEQTKQCEVGIGTNAEFYRSIGMSEMEVEQAWDGSWYLKGYCPEKPEPTIEEKSNQVKSIRNQYLSDTLARCDRYEKQKAIGLDTTESEDTYRNYLLYLQYLRDVPQSADFPNIEVLTFDEWKEINSSDIVLTEKETESEVI